VDFNREIRKQSATVWCCQYVRLIPNPGHLFPGKSSRVLLDRPRLFVRHRRCLLMAAATRNRPRTGGVEPGTSDRCSGSGSCTDRSETCLQKGKSFHTITITWPAACANKPTARHKHTHVHPSLWVSRYPSI